MSACEDLWVFAYGSLMWRPGFAFVQKERARLLGYRRDMCFLSIHYRGTAAHPGLVCGLMPYENADCEGVVYRVVGDAAEAAVAYLDGRELVSGIYLPMTLPVILEDGQRVFARTYVADTAHAQFAGDWNDVRKAAAILSACGSEGRAYDYMRELMAHLNGLGVADSRLAELWMQVEVLRASSPDVST